MVRSVGCSIGYSVPRGQRTRERWRGLCWVLRGTDGGKPMESVRPSGGTMTRFLLALAGLAAVASCSERRNQDTGANYSLARPLEEAPAERSAASKDTAVPPPSAAENRSSRVREQRPDSAGHASPAGTPIAARRRHHPAPASARTPPAAPTPAQPPAPAPNSALPSPASTPIPSASPAPDTAPPPAPSDSTWASDTGATARRERSQASAALAGQ
jgi:hypothetical protein